MSDRRASYYMYTYIIVSKIDKTNCSGSEREQIMLRNLGVRITSSSRKLCDMVSRFVSNEKSLFIDSISILQYANTHFENTSTMYTIILFGGGEG